MVHLLRQWRQCRFAPGLGLPGGRGGRRRAPGASWSVGDNDWYLVALVEESVGDFLGECEKNKIIKCKVSSRLSLIYNLHIKLAH